MATLDSLDLTLSIPDEEYERRLPVLQMELARQVRKLYKKKKNLVVVFEGVDAAGKGGAIRRLIHSLDTELFRIVPSSAPSPEEKSRHYLWRYWRAIPVPPGRIVIFDRSWYGRVLVERVEGFARPEEWGRAYEEINAMERSWAESGMGVVKFWLHIDQKEQLARFQRREKSPLKTWKLTDEDWRNREKWPLYRLAIQDMLANTDTGLAPWYLIAANDKKYARIRVLEETLASLENY